MTENFEALIGYHVQVIMINEDRDLILFNSRDDAFVFRAWGDCCATLIFEDIEYPSKKQPYGWRIDGVEEVEKYGYRLKTFEGDIVISCRRTDDAWDGYDTGVEILLYQNKPMLEKEKDIKWVEFKEAT